MRGLRVFVKLSYSGAQLATTLAVQQVPMTAMLEGNLAQGTSIDSRRGRRWAQGVVGCSLDTEPLRWVGMTTAYVLFSPRFNGRRLKAPHHDRINEQAAVDEGVQTSDTASKATRAPSGLTHLNDMGRAGSFTFKRLFLARLAGRLVAEM